MNKPNAIRVVGAVLDDKQLLLYKEDGTTISILQGDVRLQQTLDTVVPEINRQGWSILKQEHTSSYAGFEKKTGIKLFRIAKDLVKHLFSTDEERQHIPTDKNLTVGRVPTEQVPTPQSKAQADAIAAVQEKKEPDLKPKRQVPVLGEGLLTKAKPIGEDMSPIQQDETVVAVVGDQVVPGMEMLKGQFDHIQRNNSEKGLKALLERLGPMIGQRGHSVEDILRFLEKGDLPIADDGSVIAYKVLKTNGNSPIFANKQGRFFDCHTGRVPQQVGSFVTVDESLVDKSRRNECSNGLHIARRGYIHGFSGDVLVLCKIAPEDIITVPHGDPNKVRVCGYHIIAKLSDKDHATLRSNLPMTDNDEAQILLAKAIAGDHIGRIEEVRITQQSGNGIVITELKKEKGFEVTARKSTEPQTVQKAKALSLDDPKAASVDPKKVAATQAAAKAKSAKPATKASTAGKVAAKPAKAAVAAPKKAPATKAPEPTKAAAAKPMSRAEEAKSLFDQMNDTALDLGKRKESARRLLWLKKAAKVSWISLGFKSYDVPAEIEAVINLPETAKAVPEKKVAKPKANAPAAVPAAKSGKTPVKSVKATKPAQPTRTESTKAQSLKVEENKLDARQTQALKALRAGKTKAEVSRSTNISVRSLGRLLDKFGK